MKKNIIVVTGGAGFVGTNLIKYFLENTNFKIISIDNYSTGAKKNHSKNKRVSYIKGETKDIKKLLSIKIKNINAIFHFGEFSRIYQSFLKMKDVYEYTSPRALSAYIDSCIVETKIGIKGFDIGADVNTIPLLRTTELDSPINCPECDSLETSRSLSCFSVGGSTSGMTSVRGPSKSQFR